MNDEEIKKLGEKVAAGTATKEETLVFMKELNSLLEEFKTELKK